MADTATAADTERLSHIVHRVGEFVHHSLTGARALGSSRVMSRCLDRELREHACILHANPLDVTSSLLIIDPKTVARRTQIGACATTDASLADRFPYRCIKQLSQLVREAVSLDWLELRFSGMPEVMMRILFVLLALAFIVLSIGQLSVIATPMGNFSLYKIIFVPRRKEKEFPSISQYS